MGISSAVDLVFPAVVAYGCNCPLHLSQVIYKLPGKRLEIKAEAHILQVHKVKITWTGWFQVFIVIKVAQRVKEGKKYAICWWYLKTTLLFSPTRTAYSQIAEI
jgi:hypothetical protein